MAKNDLIQCSRCGSTDSVDVRFGACVATSSWYRNNYPAPNTQVTTNDDIRLWRIPLCMKCIPSGYRLFLQNHRKKMATLLGWFSLFLVLGVVAIYFNLAADPRLFTPLRWILAAAVTFGLFAGVVGVPVCTVKLIIDLGRLKDLERSGVVPAKQIEKSFIGEGQRIIKALSPDRRDSPEKVWGEFPLPVHKKLDHPTRQERDIVAVGKTIDEMEKLLPSEWKSLWEMRKE